MGIVSLILLVIFVIAALVMMAVILLQDDQGEGLAGMFGGGATTPVGSRSGNVLTRFTSILAAVFIVGALALAWLNRTPESSDILQRARAERLQTQDSQNWWVERIEAPAEAASSTADTSPESAAPAAQGAQESTPAAGNGVPDSVPESINR
jgi:preprotein translocase subunit SecG